jgi:glycosyltransferase involved in cell wall biosynthesis
MVIANPLARLAGVPAVITTFHHMAGPGRVITNQRLHGLYYRLEGLVGRWATDICVCYAEPARWDAIAVRGVPADRVAVVDNGIDLRRFTPLEGPDRRKARAAARDRLGLPPGSFVVGAVGRMIPAKGHEHLIAAFARMRSGRPDAVLVIVGDGPLADRVRGQIRSLGLEGVTFLPGTLPVTPELYGAFDVFVYPSVVGVFGLVVLEAMACGVPVLCTAGGPTDEFTDAAFAHRIQSVPIRKRLTDNESGDALEPDCDHLVELMRNAARSPDRGREAGARAARHAVANFSWDTVTDRLLASLLPTSG